MLIKERLKGRKCGSIVGGNELVKSSHIKRGHQIMVEKYR